MLTPQQIAARWTMDLIPPSLRDSVGPMIVVVQELCARLIAEQELSAKLAALLVEAGHGERCPRLRGEGACDSACVDYRQEALRQRPVVAGVKEVVRDSIGRLREVEERLAGLT